MGQRPERLRANEHGADVGNKIWRLWWTPNTTGGSGWQAEDVPGGTGAAGAPQAVFAGNGSYHVVYADVGNKIWHLWWTPNTTGGSGWQAEDVPGGTGAG